VLKSELILTTFVRSLKVFGLFRLFLFLFYEDQYAKVFSLKESTIQRFKC